MFIWRRRNGDISVNNSFIDSLLVTELVNILASCFSIGIQSSFGYLYVLQIQKALLSLFTFVFQALFEYIFHHENDVRNVSFKSFFSLINECSEYEWKISSDTSYKCCPCNLKHVTLL